MDQDFILSPKDIEVQGEWITALTPWRDEEPGGWIDLSNKVTHIFVGADRDHIADAATGNQFFELIIKSRVAQHMADVYKRQGMVPEKC